jgi:hypothetical protein
MEHDAMVAESPIEDTILPSTDAKATKKNNPTTQPSLF